MKRICLGISSLLLVGLMGCTGGTSGGQTSATEQTKEGTFKLDVPNLSTSLKQGETKEITIGIDREKNFSQDVELTFSEPPKGVTFEPAKPTLKASEKDVKVKIKASDEAAVGKNTITVTGKPTKGAEAANKFDISIDKK